MNKKKYSMYLLKIINLVNNNIKNYNEERPDCLPLSYAIINGNEKLVKYLITHGANMDKNVSIIHGLIIYLLFIICLFLKIFN